MTQQQLPGGLSISQVAERTGLSVHTIRFYEAEGILVDPVERAAGGRRRYREHDVEWLTICTNLRSSGMPIPEIRQYAELVRAGVGNEADRLDLLRRHREEVLARIARLHEWLDVISRKVEIYEDRLALGATSRLWVEHCSAVDRSRQPERDGVEPPAAQAVGVHAAATQDSP